MYIINADDFGISPENNEAIFEAANFGLLKSTSAMINTPYCDYKLIEKLQLIKDFRVGVHLNIFEFSTMQNNRKETSKLYDKNGEFHNSFGYVLKNSFDKEFLADIEKEYRLQIETAVSHFAPSHIDSHVHMHAIPNLFKIVCKLAVEYNIPYVRTQFEIPYFVPDLKMFSKTNMVNLIKVGLLDFFTVLNKKELKKYNLKTNDFIVGVQYTGNMDTNTLYFGYKANSHKNKLTEALLHPTKNIQKKENYIEYKSLLDEKLLTKLTNKLYHG